MRIVILGASGMLGNAILRLFSKKTNWEVFGTLRSTNTLQFFPPKILSRLITNCDVDDNENLRKVIMEYRPDVVINCIGLIKHLADKNDPFTMISINALLPHRLSNLCAEIGARLIHISTDCVFSGDKGGYREDDICDAQDMYGRSKYLGEVHQPHCITLRTSIIGHELITQHGLVEWFLAQDEQCKGYTRAIFSGLPTIVLAQFIRDIIIPKPDLKGLYHVAAKPISKDGLLRLIAEIYGKKIQINPDDNLIIDRSLNADRLNKVTGYVAPDWPELIKMMYLFQ